MAYSKHQLEMVRLARRIAHQRGASPRVTLSLLEAMSVESRFNNLNRGDRDSQGVLQQRPSQGWGAPGNPGQDINQYLDRAIRADKQGFKGSAGQLAQAVQRSAFPERYDQRAAEAKRLLGMKLGGGVTQGSGPNVGTSGAQANVSGLTGDAFKSAIVSQMLASSQALAAGQAPNAGGLLALAVMRRQQGGGSTEGPGSAVSGMGGSREHGSGPLKGWQPGRPIVGGSAGGEHGTSGLSGYTGVDYFAPPGAAAVAPAGGTVVKLSGYDPKRGAVQGSGGPLGWSVYIRDKQGRMHYMTHMGSRNVRVGQTVKAGQKIGTVANYDKYGRPSHIHYGVRG